MADPGRAAADKQKNPPKILFEEDGPGYYLRLELHKDALECRCNLVPKDREMLPDVEAIRRLLAEHQVTHGIDEGQLLALCRSAARGKQVTNFLLAQGLEPTAGPDGYLELMVKASDAPAYQEDEKGNIDFRTLNFFSNVVPEQKIGEVRPPQYGKPGYTVTGVQLPAILGTPLALIAGTGTRLENDGKIVIAEMEGRVIVEDKTVLVSEELVVQGDVNLAVGHIDFRGFVEVRGDVLDDFNIHAGKGIAIKGYVGICRISSDGDIALSGMAGQGEGHIICRGNLAATYLNDVTVYCDGDVIVKNEIRNSRIFCLGKVDIGNGNIYGGETYGLAGIEAKNAGAVSGVKTHLYAGINHEELSLVRALDTVQFELAEVNDKLVILSYQLKLNKPLSSEDKKLALQLTQRLEELNARKAEILESLAEARTLTQKSANGKINVKSRLGEGVVLHIGDSIEEIKFERLGAVSMIEDRENGGIHFLSLSPLSKTAGILQEELSEKEVATTEEPPPDDGVWGR